MPTQVAFSKTAQIQQQTDLGSFQTSQYQSIRVLADSGQANLPVGGHRISSSADS